MTTKVQKALLLVTLLGTFFSYGCTVSQRQALMDEAKAYALAEIEKAGPKIQAAIEAKMIEAEKKKLDELDAQLAQLKVVDPDTGEADPNTVKTWKSFDSDNNGSLSEIETAKAGAWVTKELASRVATGKMSKEQASNIGKTTGAVLAALLLLGLGKRGGKAVLAKFGPAQPGNPPPPPTPPGTASGTPPGGTAG